MGSLRFNGPSANVRYPCWKWLDRRSNDTSATFTIMCENRKFTWSPRSSGMLRRTVLEEWISWPSKMGPIGCPETSVTSYQPMPRNISEKRRPQLHRGGNLKSRKKKNLRLWSFPRLCPLVLLKVGCRQGRTSGSEEGRGDGKWTTGVCTRREKSSIWAKFSVWMVVVPRQSAVSALQWSDVFPHHRHITYEHMSLSVL
jgi:hypothetical protein